MRVLIAATAAFLCAGVDGATLVRRLDPWTEVKMSDYTAEGTAIEKEEGAFKFPHGLSDPVNATPRIMYVAFRTNAAERSASAVETPLIKVNQVGYLSAQPKFAFLGGWLGPKYGAWRPHDGVSSWRIVDASSKSPVLEGTLPGPKPFDPLTGESPYAIDFSSVTNPGVYRVEVPGVGISREFKISDSAAEDAFRVHMLGLYHKRCGCGKGMPFTHWTSGECHTDVVRGLFPPDEGVLTPKVRMFEIVKCSTDWSAPTLKLPGGWHDAADFDRRPMHLSIVNDLAAVYLMKPGNFRDGQLAIPENANGVPDILDEAAWGLRHLLAAQERGGGVGTWIETTRHPVPGEGPTSERGLRYALSRATRSSSMDYAAHASLLARCSPVFKDRFLASAVAAWDFAMRPRTEDDVFEVRRPRRLLPDEKIHVSWKGDREVSAAWLLKAALNLHALTGDPKYVVEARKASDRFRKEAAKQDWHWTPLLFSGERAAGGIPSELKPDVDWWFKRVVSKANKVVGSVAKNQYRNPTSGAPSAWGVSHPLVQARALVAAHAATGKAEYLEAAYAALDFHNGVNPNGTTLTSGLGVVYPTSFLDLPSYTDGIAEYVPGITPYRWTGRIPPKAVELCWKGDAKAAEAWPAWRRYNNFENQTVAASEYTVWETIAPAAAVTGYLIVPSASSPLPPPREPCGSLSSLPGYWSLP